MISWTRGPRSRSTRRTPTSLRQGAPWCSWDRPRASPDPSFSAAAPARERFQKEARLVVAHPARPVEIPDRRSLVPRPREGAGPFHVRVVVARLQPDELAPVEDDLGDPPLLVEHVVQPLVRVE